MHALQKNTYNGLALTRLSVKFKKYIENIYQFKRQTITSKVESRQNFPLFHACSANSIINDILGDSLATYKERQLEIGASHLQMLKPTANRNWIFSKDENKKYSCVGGLDNLLKHCLISRTDAINVIEKHIKYLEMNSEKIISSESAKLIKNVKEWLKASVKAADLFNQSLSFKNSTKTELKDIELDLEQVAKKLFESLAVLKNQNKELSNDNIRILILSLGFWSSIHKQSIPSMAVRNEVKMKIDDLVLSLEETSFERVLHQKIPLGRNNPMFIKDASDRLDLAHIWIFALTGGDERNDSTYKKALKNNCYPVWYIGRVTNKELGNYIVFENLINFVAI